MKMQKEIVRVENPVYMTYDEIRENFWGKQVLLTDIEYTADHSDMAGAVVRVWGRRAMMDLWRLLFKEYSDGPGTCGVEYIGDLPLFLYAGIGTGGDAS